MKSNLKVIMAAIVCFLYAANASAATGNPDSSSFNISLAVISGLILIIGYKIISVNLKKVGKNLEDNFGEKVLP